jgi:hypothetical protein
VAEWRTLVARSRSGLVALLLVWLTGCAAVAPHRHPAFEGEGARTDPEVARCVGFWRSLDDAIDGARVRDGQEVRVSGRPYLRANRLVASLLRTANAEERVALVRTMRELDRKARNAELANLPASVRAGLESTSAKPLEDTLARCGEVLLATDATRGVLSVDVPDDYQTWKRAVGLYPLVKFPFFRGVRGYQSETERVFALPLESLPVSGKLLRVTAAAPELALPDLSLGRNLSDADLFAVAARHAPVFEIDVVDDNDRPGSPYLDKRGAVGVDTTHAQMQVRLSHAPFAGALRPQLVYSIWFPSRPRTGALDLLGGSLDGITWRVTLGDDGQPLLYDTIHNCGCYHQFFPTARVRARPAPGGFDEWAFVPQALPILREGERTVVRVASRTHYLQRVSVAASPPDSSILPMVHDDSLRSLPLPAGGRRSLFDADGIVRGSERGERWLFWPMGVREPGAMRQWGRHATAFLGRRHFDDPDLLDRYFEPAP